ncbi:hypothetical protein HXT42_05000 [Gardnerella sp. DNF01192]|uniref:hypothetical protein n=1 Tax=Gardnerella TaxID=2701 RepID=UPI0039EF4948
MSKAKSYFWGFVVVAILAGLFYCVQHNPSFSGVRHLLNIKPDLNAISEKCHLPIKRSYALGGDNAIIKVGTGDNFQQAASCVLDEFPSADANHKKLENILYKNGNPFDMNDDNHIFIVSDPCSVMIFPTTAGDVMIVGNANNLSKIDNGSLMAGLMKDVSSNYGE